jgi:hypothetical protein
MDPTLSPYATPGASAGQNPQLAALLRQLLGNQQNQPGSAGATPPGTPPTGQMPLAGGQQGSNQGPYGGAGSVIKGLFNPPPTSILGQARTGLTNMFSPGGASAGTAGSPPAAPLGTGLGTYEGNIPSPANPAGPNGVMGLPSSAAGGSVTQGAGQMPLTSNGPAPTGQMPLAGASNFGSGAVNPAGPDAMTQALMAPPGAGVLPTGQMPLASAGVAGGAGSLSDMLML